MTQANEPHVTVDCYVRTDAVSDPVEGTLSAVRTLAREGTVDEWEVRTWPKEVVLSTVTEGSVAVETFRTFRRWADQWSVSIEPPFSVETRSSEFTGESRRVLKTPALCLAVYANGRLREVFPHHSKGTTHTVEDAIETLRRGVPTVNGTMTGTASPDHCPECDVQLSTGQGLYACPECEWVAVATCRGAYREYEATAQPADADAGESPLLRR
jgi:hypothetical protein